MFLSSEKNSPQKLHATTEPGCVSTRKRAFRWKTVPDCVPAIFDDVAVTIAKAPTWGSAFKPDKLQRTNVILSRQLPDPAGDLQFEESCKDLGRGQLALQIFEDFVDLEGVIRTKNFEDDRLLRPQHLSWQSRCGRLGFGFMAGIGLGFGLECSPHLRRQILPHVLPCCDEHLRR